MNRCANRHLLALAGLMAALPLGSGVAMAQEESFAKKALSTIGIIAPDQAPIDYKERAPLVVPPKYTLPPPQERVANRSPAWPVDPGTRPDTPEQTAEDQAHYDTLAASETDGTHLPTVRRRTKGGPASSGLTSVVNEASRNMNRDADSRRITGDPNDSTHIAADQEVEPDKGKPKLATGPEPDRRTLTDPPRGYRAPPKVNGVVVEAEPEKKNPFWDPLGLFSKKN
jgi:hypothetical protein